VLQEDLYQQACVHSLEEALERCARIGYPIMLKASWGGGGKGIRKVGCGVCPCNASVVHYRGCRAHDTPHAPASLVPLHLGHSCAALRKQIIRLLPADSGQ
jgi:Carbamoyl-phosphate synthase L chain, ATP binding domain